MPLAGGGAALGQKGGGWRESSENTVMNGSFEKLAWFLLWLEGLP
jgi:uncharacterized protein YjcR